MFRGNAEIGHQGRFRTETSQAFEGRMQSGKKYERMRKSFEFPITYMLPSSHKQTESRQFFLH